ncbi:MAG: CDP-alcohol phosphatidyltransferase family protein [Aristaeellaceae bacterium]
MPMANIVTGVRILLSIAMLFVPALSPGFCALYAAAGLTDMLDGPIARRTGAASDFGARLDTLADMVFAAACLIRLLPLLSLPPWLWAWIGLIALIKGISLLSGLILQQKLVALHTPLNRLTGLALFLLPLTLPFADVRITGSVLCALATVAAVQEGHLIRTEDRR